MNLSRTRRGRDLGGVDEGYAPRSRSEFPTTVADDSAIATAASGGATSTSVTGGERPGRERHRRDVVGKRPEEVPADRRERAAADRNRVRDAREVALHERAGRRLDRDAGSGAHRDAHVGRVKRRRVVDAVADHRDPRAALAQRARTEDEGANAPQRIAEDRGRSKADRPHVATGRPHARPSDTRRKHRVHTGRDDMRQTVAIAPPGTR